MAIRIAPLDDNLDFPEPVQQRQAERLGDAATAEGKAIETAVKAGASASVAPLTQASRVKNANEKALYQPSSKSTLRWRLLRAQVLNGQKQGHIAFLGDSIAFGTGSAAPKYKNSHPGQLRKMLDDQYGPTGTGIVPGNNHFLTTPTLADDRFTFSTGVTPQAWGLHEFGMFNVSGLNQHVEFTAECEDFYFYSVNTSAFNVSIDGGPNTVYRAADRLAGYSSPHHVFKVPAGALGRHTIRLSGPESGSNCYFGFEGRINGAGRWRVSNQSIDGRSLQTLLSQNAAGETGGLRGLPFIDTLKADLLVIALGINDWQASRSTAELKDRLTQVIVRQRSRGTNSIGGTHPAGEAMLLWNPAPYLEPIPTGLQPPSGPSWEAYRDMYYQVADEQDVALIDLGELWGLNFNAVFGTRYGGLFTDRIHPNTQGAGDMATSIYRALFIEA